MGNSQRTVSKFTYYFVQLSVVLILTLLEIALIIWLERSWKFIVHLRGGTGVVLPMLSFAITNRLFLWLGLSRAGRTFEERRPLHVQSERPEEVDQNLRVCVNKSLSNMLLTLVLFCYLLLFILCELIIPHLRQTDREYLPWLYGTILLLAFGSFFIRYELVAKLDGAEVLGYHVGLGNPKRYVAWEDVAACEIRTNYNTFGELASITPVFLDANRKELLALNLGYASRADRDRVLQFIRARLPKDVTGLWDLE